MNNTVAHQKLVDELLFFFGSKSYIRAWSRRVALACPVIGFEDGNPITSNRPIKFGVNGETDIEILVGPWGFRGAIEVKTGQGKLSKEQKIYRDMILTFGGIYIEARSVDQAWNDFKKEIENKCKKYSLISTTII